MTGPLYMKKNINKNSCETESKYVIGLIYEKYINKNSCEMENKYVRDRS